MDQLLLNVGRILEKLSQQDSDVRERKAEIHTLVHNEVAEVLSDNVTLKQPSKMESLSRTTKSDAV